MPRSGAESDGKRDVLRENAYGFGLGILGGRAHAVDVLSSCLAAEPDNVVSLYNLATVFQASGMPQCAAQCLELLLTRAVDNREAHTLLYRALRKGNQLEEARNAAETAYSLFPSSPDAILNLAQASLDTEQLDLAEKVLRRGIRQLPDFPALHVALARVLVRAGRAGEALHELESADVPANMEPQAASVKAFAAASKGDWPEVVEIWTGAGKTYAGDSALRVLAVAALAETGKEDAARALMKENEKSLTAHQRGRILAAALGMAPLDTVGDDKPLAEALSKDTGLLAQYACGWACLETGLHRSALAALRHVHDAVSGGPTLVDMLLQAVANGVPEEDRITEARAIVDQHSGVARAWIGLATILEAAGDIQGASAALTKAAELAPADPEVWRQQGRFGDRQKDYPAAARAYEQLVRLLPGDVEANNNLAYCILMLNGDAKRAEKLATTAWEALPADAQVLHTLGLAQMRAGNLEEGGRHLKTALELRPGDPALHFDLGQLLLAQGKVEAGANQVQLALRYSDQLGISFPRRTEAEKILADRGVKGASSQP